MSSCVDVPIREGDKLAYRRRAPSEGDACCEGLFERLTSSNYPTGEIEVICCRLASRSRIFYPAAGQVVELILPASERPMQVSATLTRSEILYRMDTSISPIPLNSASERSLTSVFHWNLSLLDQIEERDSTRIDAAEIVAVAFEEDRPFLKTSGLVYIPMQSNPQLSPEDQIHQVDEPVPIELALRAVGGQIPIVTGSWVCLSDRQQELEADLNRSLENGEVIWTSVELPCGSGTWMLSLSTGGSSVEEFQRLFVEAPELAFMNSHLAEK